MKKGKGSGWHGDSRRHSMARKGIKTAKGKAKSKKCDVPDPMNVRSNKQLLFGHSLTHTKHYQEAIGVENAECEHDRLVAIMIEKGMNHKSPFKPKTKASGIPKVTVAYLEDIIESNNKEHGTTFELRGAYGNYELWAKDKKGDHRLEAGSKRDVYEAFVRWRFHERFRGGD